MEDFLEHVVAALAVGEGLVVQAHAVQHDVRGECVEVVGDDVAAAADQSAGAGRLDQRDPRSWARTQLHVRMAAGAGHGIHDVFDISHLPMAGTQINRGSRLLNDKRHGGRINLLFLDGHVDTRPFKDVTRRDFDWLFVQ